MDAVVYTSKGEVKHTQLAEPEPGPGEILVRMKASGMCHTDVDILHGRYGNCTFPLVPGHEYAGIVEAHGEGVVGLETGDQVVVDPNIHCGACRSCRKGHAHLCENLGGYGTTLNGGFGELSVVRADHAFAVADMPADRAALAEPVGCVLNGLGSVGTDGAESALVFGAGPIGILMALALRARGVHEITVVDLQDDRLELAGSFDLGTVHARSERMASHRHGADIVIDATGVAEVAEGLTGYAANGGSVLIFGVCPPGARISLEPFEIFRRQLRVCGSHSLNHNIPEALDVIRDIGPAIDRLISHRVALSEVPSFLQCFGAAATLKVQAAGR